MWEQTSVHDEGFDAAGLSPLGLVESDDEELVRRGAGRLRDLPIVEAGDGACLG